MMDDGVTLGEAKRLILESSDLDGVLGLIGLGRSVRVRFVSLPDEDDLPDEYTVGRFRSLANHNKAKMIIDDQGGGLFARPKVPELID